MNEFDFKSWYILLAIFIAHIYRHYSVLETIPKAADALKAALNGMANSDGIKERCNEVWSAVLGFDTIILHLLAILVLTTTVFLVLNIPQKLLNVNEFGSLAYPFNIGEKVIYLIIAGLFLLSYITKAIIPSAKAVKLLKCAYKAIKVT